MSDRSVGRPLAFETVEQLQTAVDLYFETDAYISVGIDDSGEEKKMYAPTMSGLALSLGVDRKTITNYANKDEFFPAIKKARSRVEVALEQRLYGNNVTGVIFNLKNNFDWCDKNEIAHTSPDGSMTPKSVDAALVSALVNKLTD
jgi:hypothetical protein